jgi:hypothetical protein
MEIYTSDKRSNSRVLSATNLEVAQLEHVNLIEAGLGVNPHAPVSFMISVLCFYFEFSVFSKFHFSRRMTSIN